MIGTVTGKRVAIITAVVVATVWLALATPVFVPAVTGVNSHALDVGCPTTSASTNGSYLIITYPSGAVTSSNSTLVLRMINDTGVIIFTFNQLEQSANGTVITIKGMSYSVNGTAIVIHFNSTLCQQPNG